MRAVVFGSSGTEEHEQDYKDAIEVGRLLAEKGFTVLNGGYNGIMEAVSKGAFEAGGKTIGITCKHFDYTTPNEFLSEVIEAEDLFDRMKTYFTDTDLIVVFPGGSGTLTELMLSCDLIGGKLIKKQPVIVFGDYWKPVVNHVFQRNNIFDGLSHIKFVKDINELREFLEND